MDPRPRKDQVKKMSDLRYREQRPSHPTFLVKYDAVPPSSEDRSVGHKSDWNLDRKSPFTNRVGVGGVLRGHV